MTQAELSRMARVMAPRGDELGLEGNGFRVGSYGDGRRGPAHSGAEEEREELATAPGSREVARSCRVHSQPQGRSPLESSLHRHRARIAPLVEDEADTYQGTAYAAFVVMLMSGLRVGEMLGLKWADLDDKKSTLRVQRAVTQDAHRRKGTRPH
jgi:hypothetical protein